MIRLHQGKLWRTGTARCDFRGPAPLGVKVFKGSLVLYREVDFTVLFPGDPVPHSVGDFFAFHAKLVKPTWPWRCAKDRPEEVSSVSKVPLVTNPSSPNEGDEGLESWVGKLMEDPEALAAHAEKSESGASDIDTEIVWNKPEAPKPEEPAPAVEAPVTEDENPA